MKFRLLKILLLYSCLSFGQVGEQNLEEMLSFLPEGNFANISFIKSALHNPDVQLKIPAFSVEPQPGELPAAFEDLWAGKLSAIRTTYLLMEVTEQEEIDSLSLMGDPIIINDKVYKVISNDDELNVYYYMLLDSIFKEALEGKQIEELDLGTAGKYYQFKDQDGNSKIMTIMDNYLLVAPDLDQLLQMVSASRGETYAFFYQDEGRVLLRQIYKLEGDWSFWSNLPFWRSVLSQVRNLDRNCYLKYNAAGELERGCIYIATHQHEHTDANLKEYYFAAKILEPSLKLDNVDIRQVEDYTPDAMIRDMGPRHPKAPEAKVKSAPAVLYHNDQ